MTVSGAGQKMAKGEREGKMRLAHSEDGKMNERSHGHEEDRRCETDRRLEIARRNLQPH